ncbi:MAG: hypothetical protein ACE5KV_03975 [Thermoplasmata archaeon]
MHFDFNFYSVPSLLSGIFSLLILYILRKGGIKRTYEKVFALMLIGLILWSLSVFGQKLVVPPDELNASGYNYSPDTTFYYYPIALFFSKLLYPTSALTIFALLYLSFIFPKPLATSEDLRLLKYILAFLLLFASSITFLTNHLVPELLVYWAGYGAPNVALSALFYLTGGIFLITTVFSIFISYRRSKGIEKNQLRIILLGFGATAILVILTGIVPLILASFGADILPQGILIGPVFAVPFEFSIFYSILRYRLFDIQLVKRNGLINGISLGIASSVAGSVIFIPYILFKVEAHITIVFATVAFILLFLGQNSLKAVSTRIVEFLVPSLKWKECKTKEIYLIHYPSGITLTSLASESGSQLDPDIVGGMLTAVSNFVKDSFHAEDRDTIRSLAVGDVKLIIEHSRNTFLVVVFSGFESSELRTDCQKVLGRVERAYGEILRSWDGDTNSVIGLSRLISKLLPEEWRPQVGGRRPVPGFA